MKLSTKALAAAIVLATPALTQAALVTWQTPQTISGDSDVVTTGTLLYAFNLGEPTVTTATVNGVSFVAAGSSALGATTTTAPSLLSSNYFSLLNSAYVVAADTPLPVSLGGLTIGDTYLVQFWVNNSGNTPFNGRFDYFTTISDGLGNSVSLYDGDTGIGAGPGNTNLPPVLGQYVVGTFTADNLAQGFNFFSGEVNGVLNGFQLRNITNVAPAAVPEPGTALAGVMLAGLVGLRRRRN